VRAFKASRDEPLARHALQRLEETARREMNLTPTVIEAVKAGATLGEISDTLRTVHGGHDPNA
jgi:methylmalonyl-CoA mutase N-terminal domain/subunit